MSLDYNDHGRVLVYQPKTKLDLTKEVEVSKFAFDNVYDEISSNMDIYNSSVKDLIPGVFHGKWASVFAYGRYRWKVVIINISMYYNTCTSHHCVFIYCLCDQVKLEVVRHSQ